MENIDGMFSSDGIIAGLGIGVIVIIGIVLFIVHVLICLIPFFMARKRGRSGLLWFVISLIIGWFWTIIILLIVGDTAEKKLNDMQMLNGNYQKE
ncbi:MAG: hypothetical protein J5770_04930 [Bacteroidaceae bacterium]|nr:hypothetical protein [Bacteroidaceae bacterium]